jgi:two-component system, chemotaxis family, chemotaxis protein CheY
MKYKNILIVDDSSTSLMIMKRCFEIAGLSESNYFFAQNGIEALSSLDENSIDLIVTDINMPKMDGDNFIKKIKTDDNRKNIPIIVITSVGNSNLENELFKLGIKGIIRKPLSPEKLVVIIGDILGEIE